MQVKGFKEFLLRGNVVDLAVAVVIGASFGNVVNAFVKDLLTPLIAAIGGAPDFSALHFTIRGSRFNYGDFINSIVSFFMVSSIIYYFVLLPMGTLLSRINDKEPVLPTKRKCPECLSEIPIQAHRCAFCAQPVSSADT